MSARQLAIKLDFSAVYICDIEKNRRLAEGKANGRQLPKGEGIQRYKGLGEMSYQELWETTMDPDHRILKQVHIADCLLYTSRCV